MSACYNADMPLSPTYSDLVYKVDDIQGRKVEKWLLNGCLHSIDDIPSMVINDGEEQHWHTHGLRHRDGGPAIINAIGKQVWYKLDSVHRSDGPAKIYPDGTEEFWWEGRPCADIREWLQFNPCKTEDLVMLKLKYL